MAHRMKWLIGVIAACAVIVLLVRSIDVRNGFGDEIQSPNAAMLSMEIYGEERALREVVWADVLLPRVPVTQGMHVDVVAKIDSASNSMLHNALQSEWASIGNPVARVAVFVIPDTLGQHYSAVGSRLGGMYYAGTDAAGPHCVVVIPTTTIGTGMQPPARRFHSPLLGPCYWWAKHGQPGERLAAWLTDVGYDLGSWQKPPDTTRAGVSLERRFARQPAAGELSTFAQACIDDNTEACAHAVTDPLEHFWWQRTATEDALSIYRTTPFGNESHFAGQERFIFAQLEREFGAQRFRQFWQSDKGVDEAFTAAFGIRLDEWVQQWARARFPDLADQSENRPLTLALSFLTLLVTSGVGIIAAHRRQIR